MHDTFSSADCSIGCRAFYHLYLWRDCSLCLLFYIVCVCVCVCVFCWFIAIDTHAGTGAPGQYRILRVYRLLKYEPKKHRPKLDICQLLLLSELRVTCERGDGFSVSVGMVSV